jgi:hypothetical protein
MILVQMGTKSANPGRTNEDAARYNDGLKKIVQDLRSQNIKDAETIAGRIAQFRRDFVNDPTVLVGLD